jgi:hypothetical protein
LIEKAVKFIKDFDTGKFFSWPALAFFTDVIAMSSSREPFVGADPPADSAVVSHGEKDKLIHSKVAKATKIKRSLADLQCDLTLRFPRDPGPL